jgi:hypothetical protein
MKAVVRYLLIGRQYHRGISSGRPAGCKHISDFRVLWQRLTGMLGEEACNDF